MQHLNESLENICSMAYEAIKSQNEEAILLLKKRIPKNLKDLTIITIYHFLLVHKNQIHDLLTMNKIKLEIDHNNIQILAEEIRILFTLIIKSSNFQKTEDQKVMMLFIKILEYLNKINSTRISYVKENSNEGRIAASNYQIRNIEEYLETTDKLQEELKRKRK